MPISHIICEQEPAYAKINLALHLLRRRADGYHLLDSLVAFVDAGDTLTATLADDGLLSLRVDGAFGHMLSDANQTDNLVIKAARRLQEHARTPLGAQLHLTKHIPVGAGLGGGSADAAAALRLLNRLWRLGYSTPALSALAESIGADVPACVFSGSTRMEGIGELLSPVPHLPAFPVVLLYPHAPLWTPQVYGAMSGKAFSGILQSIPAIGADNAQWLTWLAQHTQNDLQQAALELSPHIAPMLTVLESREGCHLARMSGSGSACFGVFSTAQQAHLAVQSLQQAHPQWWVRGCTLLPETTLCTDTVA